MLAPLIDQTPVCYLGNDNRLVWRPCRKWQLDERRIFVVVSETTDPSKSIETAAEEIRLTLEGLLRVSSVVIVEHWPEQVGLDGEHYAEQFWHPDGRIGWKHVAEDALRCKLADFDATKPSCAPLEPRAVLTALFKQNRKLTSEFHAQFGGPKSQAL